MLAGFEMPGARQLEGDSHSVTGESFHNRGGSAASNIAVHNDRKTCKPLLVY